MILSTTFFNRDQREGRIKFQEREVTLKGGEVPIWHLLSPLFDDNIITYFISDCQQLFLSKSKSSHNIKISIVKVRRRQSVPFRSPYDNIITYIFHFEKWNFIWELSNAGIRFGNENLGLGSISLYLTIHFSRWRIPHKENFTRNLERNEDFSYHILWITFDDRHKIWYIFFDRTISRGFSVTILH